MTPEEKLVVKGKLREIAEILYQDISLEELKTFESIELSAKKHLLETVNPEIGSFFYDTAREKRAGRKRKIKTCIGQIKISNKQAVRLKLRI